MATPVPHSEPATSSETEPVVLVASARFIVREHTIPEGVRPRDLVAYMEGLIEENAPLPIDYVSWGYLGKIAGKSRNVLTYAAAKEQVFGPSRRAVPQRPTLPAFAALAGLRVKEPTWVFLADDSSLAAALLRPGTPLPERISSRYLENQSAEAQWATRTRLIADIKPAKDETLQPGLLRISNTTRSASRITFHLRYQHKPGDSWEAWQQTSLSTQAAIDGADLRDHALLLAQKDQVRSGRSLRLALAGALLAIIAVAALEATLHSRSSVAEELTTQVKKQADAVQQLQQMEAMTKALEATLSHKSQPFELLAAANSKRPDTVYFKTMSINGGNQLRLSGEADNIQAVNNYAAALKEDGYWEQIDLSDVRTEATGAATFQFILKPIPTAKVPKPAAPRNAQPTAQTQPAASAQPATAAQQATTTPATSAPATGTPATAGATQPLSNSTPA